MIDFIQVVMVFVIYHVEINSVQVQKKMKNKKNNNKQLAILGHSIEEVRGHELFLSDPKPIINYNGLFGKKKIIICLILLISIKKRLSS